MNLLVIFSWLGLASIAQAAGLPNVDIPYGPVTAPLIIEAAASKFGVDKDTLVNVAQCESGLQNLPPHWDVTGDAYGEMQFHKETFYSNAKELGLKNPDITDPVQQAIVAAYMFSQHKEQEWTCYKPK